QGGGARYPYPKDVWSPAGGWWTRPKNWVSNTLVIGAGAAVIVYGVWSWSAKNEVRPSRAVPSSGSDALAATNSCADTAYSF
ncbi:hypothetical protein EXIGLDRAFT_613169, partial [Exidia glandulosa HHB12029]